MLNKMKEATKKIVKNSVNNIKVTEEILSNDRNLPYNFWNQVSAEENASEIYLEYFSEYISWKKVFKTNHTISKECFFRHYDGNVSTLRTILKENVPLSEKIISDIGKNGSSEEIFAIDIFLEGVNHGMYFTTNKVVDDFQNAVIWNENIPDSLRYKFTKIAKKNFIVGDKVHSKFYPRLVIGGKEGGIYSLINMEGSKEDSFDVIFLGKDDIEKGWE